MKKHIRRAALLAAAAMALSGAGALAELSFEGRVVAKTTDTVGAPFGGLVDSVAVRAGDTIEIGDPVATLETTKVYATADGVVGGVFAEPGDDTEGVVERYGAVVYIEPTNRYTVSASTEKAYNSSETKYVHIGERVYLSCTKDGTHTGTAVVTSVGSSASGGDSGDGGSASDDAGVTSYTLEITGGEFYMGETVGIFRSRDYASSSRIGRGTVGQNAAIPVKGSGSVLKMHVSVGDPVERGELLFETVAGTLDGLYPVDNRIVSNVAGVVASVDAAPGSSVDKGAKLITVYPAGSFQIEVHVSELDLAAICAGDQVSVEFDWDADGAHRVTGTVASISRVNVGSGEEGGSAASSGGAEYSAYIDFEADAATRLGLSAMVYLAEPGAPAEGEE